MKLGDLVKIIIIIGLFLVFYELLIIILSIIGILIFLPIWLTSPQFICFILVIVLIILYFKSKK